MAVRHRRLTPGALVGRSRSLGDKLHIIKPGTVTSYCFVPVLWWADENHQKEVCRNCIREMTKITDRKVEKR